MYLLTAKEIRKILKAKKTIEIDLSLNSGAKIVRISRENDKIYFDNTEELSVAELKKRLNDENSVYFIKNGRLEKLGFFSGHSYYKLVPTADAPTLEISGIRMHASTDISPLEDAKRKIRLLDPRGGFCLDTCGGLGYTAIYAAERNCRVLSTEIDVNVLFFAKINPWSAKYFGNEQIDILIADIVSLVKTLPSEKFDYIIHDPPRISIAGELYSAKFYTELYRVLKSGGRIFHYTGEPKSKYRGFNIYASVAKRLSTVGFRILKIDKTIKGILAVKK